MKKIIILLLALLVLVSLGCTQTTPAQTSEAPSEMQVALTINVFDGSGENIFTKNQNVLEGTNAFEAMKTIMGDDLEFEMYSFGPFVKKIVGVEPSTTSYWALYVNGEFASKGISDYVIDADTLIEWKLDEIDLSSME